MCRFHCARAAAARHQKALTAERCRDACDTAVDLRSARLVMAAHDGGDSWPSFQKCESGLRDRVVMQRLEETRQRVARGGAPVRCVLGETLEVESVLQGMVVGRIECASVAVVIPGFANVLKKMPDGWRLTRVSSYGHP